METKVEIVPWVAKSMHPFKIVTDHRFQLLMKTGHPGYYIPSPQTVSHDIKHMFVKVHQRIATMLQTHKGVLHFGMDAWTSPNHKAYVAVTIHYELEEVLVSMLLDLVEVACLHLGINIAAAFAKILDNFGISSKVLSIVCNNSTNNDTMITELAHLLESFLGAANQLHCFVHILNLAAQSVLRQFNAPKEKDGAAVSKVAEELAQLLTDLESDELRDYGAEDLFATSDNHAEEGALIEDNDVEGWVDEMAELSDDKQEEIETDPIPVHLMLVKLRKISYAIKNLTTILLPKWISVLEKMELSDHMIPHDVATHWNSTFDMLDFCLAYKRPIQLMTADFDLGLHDYELNRDE